MEPIYRHQFRVNDAAVDCYGRLKPSMMLYYCQEIAGLHCLELGADWDTLAKKNLFWAIIRQKVQITRVPRSGETITVETWPMPTTRTCYPRSTVAYDESGNECFRSIGMWVLMDMDSRSMILPGKSGVDVQGTLTGLELAAPGSLAPMKLEQAVSRRVAFTDLDRNGHMNNTRYLDWIADLLPSAFHKDHEAKEFTVCYHSEARETEQLNLHWQLEEGGLLRIDAHRENTDVSPTHNRVFAAQMLF